ncbi:MAG TPA: RsmE family RNA methyltransferase [Acidimicrobiales bacterium]|nr:RsmE family RNA methyltransferase [Acidimicrobiales bacterium]
MTGAGPAQVGAVAQVFVDDLDTLDVCEDDAHHLGRSLRLRPGELVVAADGAGRWRTCRYRSGSPLEADGAVVETPRPARLVTVGFVPVKGERPEWVVQKLTELGVDRIVVLSSARSVVRWQGERADRSVDRLRRVAREAAAQSRRAWMATVDGVWSLSDLRSRLAPERLALADPGGEPPDGGVLAVAVGPEGGWDDAELASAPSRLGLGPGVLRAETAALASGTLLCALRDGMFGHR